MAIDGLDFVEVCGAGYQHAVINRDRHLANQRQGGVLEQIVNVIDRPGTGVLDRHNSVIRLSGLHLIKDIRELRAAAFNKLFEMTGRILTRGKVGIGTFRPQEGNTRRMRVSFV